MTKWLNSYLPDFVMIISVPSSLKRSHRSRLSKVTVTLSRSSETSEEETVVFAASIRTFSLLLSPLVLNLFPFADAFVSSSLVQGFFLFASSVPGVEQIQKVSDVKVTVSGIIPIQIQK